MVSVLGKTGEGKQCLTVSFSTKKKVLSNLLNCSEHDFLFEPFSLTHSLSPSLSVVLYLLNSIFSSKSLSLTLSLLITLSLSLFVTHTQ